MSFAFDTRGEEKFDPVIPEVLPHGKMYKLQVGDRLFVVSGASLSSDAPSYFTNYFSSNNEDKPLFLDRSPDIFNFIYQHLQGYHIDIPNGEIFTKLFSDSIYFSLPRLKDLLLKDDYYYAEMLNDCIKVPKKLLHTEGNYPNFFSVTYEALYRDLSELMISRRLIRPPPQAFPRLNRDGALLKELIKLLQGVGIEIRSDEHKRMLIKEAKYYRFNAIVEKLSYEQIFKPVKLSQNSNLNHESIVVDINDVTAKNFVKKLYSQHSDQEEESEPRSKRQKTDSGDQIDSVHYEYQRKYGIDPQSRRLIIRFGKMNGVTAHLTDDTNHDRETKPSRPYTIQFHNDVELKIRRIIIALKKQSEMTKLRVNNQELKYPGDEGNFTFSMPSFAMKSSADDKFSEYLNEDTEEAHKSDKLILLNSFWKFEAYEDNDTLDIRFTLLKADHITYNDAEVYKNFLPVA